MDNIIKIGFMVTLLVVVIGFGPLVTIWALNTLFPVLAIPFTLATWFAVVWLGAFVTLKYTK